MSTTAVAPRRQLDLTAVVNVKMIATLIELWVGGDHGYHEPSIFDEPPEGYEITRWDQAAMVGSRWCGSTIPQHSAYRIQCWLEELTPHQWERHSQNQPAPGSDWQQTGFHATSICRDGREILVIRPCWICYDPL